MSNNPGIQKKCCLIIGGTSDLGKAIACQFAGKQFDLILTARNPERYDLSFSDTLAQEYQVSIRWLEFDALHPLCNKRLLSSLPLIPEIVVCVIGYLGNQAKALSDMDELMRINTINYLAPAAILIEIARVMQQKQEGCIIGISSPAGARGRKSNYFYGAAKAAFSTYLSGLRNSLSKSGVHVITVIPGYLRTKMTKNMPLPRLLTTTPEKFAPRIWSGYRKKSNFVYSSTIWKLLILMVKIIPEPIFKKMNL